MLRWSLVLCLLTAFAFAFPRNSYANGASLGEIRGKVLVRSKASQLWNQVSKGFTLKSGDAVKTRRHSNALLIFDDGTKVEVGSKSFFVLKDVQANKKTLNFSFGRMKAWVRKSIRQRFTVRTPTAVCSVRGTEFSVNVAQGSGATQVSLFKGLLGVADIKGNEVLLKPGQSVDVNKQGLGATSTKEAKSDGKQSLREAIKKEVGLEMTKEEVQAAAALEMKSAVYKDGKALIDVSGNRVRVESYIIRSAANQFKMVVLNSRVNRFDYFFYKGTFNTTLPENLRDALVQTNGCIGTACTWYLTDRERALSSTIDTYRVVESGGHQVDLNSNGVAGDDVTQAVDFRSGSLVGVTGAYFKTLFDEGNVTYNNVSHSSWEPSLAAGNWVKNGGAGIQNLSTDVTDNPVTLAANATQLVVPPNCSSLDNCTDFRSDDKFHQIIYAEVAGGSVWDKQENYIINDQGDVVARSGFPTNNNALFKQALLEVNYQTIITASEFAGRKIDLVVTPRILIESGLIQ